MDFPKQSLNLHGENLISQIILISWISSIGLFNSGMRQYGVHPPHSWWLRRYIPGKTGN